MNVRKVQGVRKNVEHQYITEDGLLIGGIMNSWNSSQLQMQGKRRIYIVNGLKIKKIIQIKPHLNYSTDIRKISKRSDLLRNIKKKQILLIWKWRSLEIYRMIIKFLLKK